VGAEETWSAKGQALNPDLQALQRHFQVGATALHDICHPCKCVTLSHLQACPLVLRIAPPPGFHTAACRHPHSPSLAYRLHCWGDAAGESPLIIHHHLLGFGQAFRVQNGDLH
jgi:hypothetical protein